MVMSSFVLKLIAIITMLIDHIGAVFISPTAHPELYVLFRGTGRLAFPIFVFLIVEGFHHTKDVKKYLKRLGIFALISEIPFDLAFYQYHYHSEIINDIENMISADNEYRIGLQNNLIERLNSSQNVFFTLFLGLLLIYIMSLVEKQYRHQMLVNNLLNGALTIGFCALAYIIKTDYSVAGILLIVAFYLFRGSKTMLTIVLLIITSTILSNINSYRATGNILYIISTFATLSMIPIALYNGKKGKSVKYIFYIFYPAHLLIIYLISQFILLS
jgi:hypothetical protein